MYSLFNPSTAHSKTKTNPWHTSVNTGQHYLFPVFSRTVLVVLFWNSGTYNLSALFKPCNPVTSSDTHHSFIMVPKFFRLVLKLNTSLLQGKCPGNTPESPTSSLRKRNMSLKYSRVLLREMKVGFYLSSNLFQMINVTVRNCLNSARSRCLRLNTKKALFFSGLYSIGLHLLKIQISKVSPQRCVADMPALSTVTQWSEQGSQKLLTRVQYHVQTERLSPHYSQHPASQIVLLSPPTKVGLHEDRSVRIREAESQHS